MTLLTRLITSRNFHKCTRLRAWALAGLVGLAASPAAFAQAFPPIACDNRLYISQGVGGTALSRSNGNLPLNFATVGPGAVSYNAMGVSPSGHLYAIQRDSTNLVQISPLDGSVSSGVPVTGLGANNGFQYNSGTFSPAGTFYVKRGAFDNSLYAINIGTASATRIGLNRSLSIADLAWAAGALYAVDLSGQLVSIDVTPGATYGHVTNVGTIQSNGRLFGALFGFTDGLYGAENAGGGFFQFDLGNGTQEELSLAPAAPVNNDGANCPAASFIPPPEPPVPPAPTPVPGLGKWGVTLLAGLLGLAGLAGLRQRRTR